MDSSDSCLGLVLYLSQAAEHMGHLQCPKLSFLRAVAAAQVGVEGQELLTWHLALSVLQ